MEQRSRLAKSSGVLAQRVHPSTERRHRLPHVEMKPLHEGGVELPA